MALVERLLDFPLTLATIVYIKDIVGEEDLIKVANTIKEGVVSTPSRGKYSPRIKA